MKMTIIWGGNREARLRRATHEVKHLLCDEGMHEKKKVFDNEAKHTRHDGLVVHSSSSSNPFIISIYVFMNIVRKALCLSATSCTLPEGVKALIETLLIERVFCISMIFKAIGSPSTSSITGERFDAVSERKTNWNPPFILILEAG